MDRITRGWLKGLGLAGVLLLLGSMLSFDLFDPTITNLRLPKDGIANFASLPGALLGGSLVELLGASALWIPALLANWMLLPAHRRAVGPYLLFGGAATLFSATLHGLVVEDTLPGLTASGLAGIAGSRWMLRTAGSLGAVLLLAPALAFALAQVIHVPILRTAVRDTRLISRYVFARALARAAAWRNGRLRRRMARAAEAGRGATRRGAGRRGPFAWLGQWRSPAAGAPSAAPSIAAAERVMRARGAGTPRFDGTGDGAAGAGTSGNGSARSGGGDGFEAWLSALGEPPPEPERADKT